MLPNMRVRGFGRILFTSSVAALTGGIVGPHYASSKAGLHGLTHFLASRVALDGATVNAIAALAVSRQTINSIEQDRYTPSLPLALALAGFFETTVEHVFDADGGHSGSPYAWLGAIAGLAYLLAIIVLRFRG